ncbi:hypothetical protein [Desulfovibrio sp.]|nr:hypothetical protein [Desulfovibrio sp.]
MIKNIIVDIAWYREIVDRAYASWFVPTGKGVQARKHVKQNFHTNQGQA